jgi:hypothetical protein
MRTFHLPVLFVSSGLSGSSGFSGLFGSSGFSGLFCFSSFSALCALRFTYAG